MKKLFIPLVFPLIAFAQVPNPALSTPLGGLMLRVLGVVDLLFPIVGALALIWFFWGIIQYVLKGENIEKREQSRNFMIYAVIAFFVMFSIWGLVHIIQNTFFLGFGPGTSLLLDTREIPTVPPLK